ncbi:hypothetical protein ABOONEI_2134 [Aciduliprofundum boonei T469]|nr:hypothetical protein ABOONEI_2134 [Aciduliprofundum boonei T469]
MGGKEDVDFLTIVYSGKRKGSDEEISGLLFLYYDDIEELAEKKLAREYDFDDVEIEAILETRYLEENDWLEEMVENGTCGDDSEGS